MAKDGSNKKRKADSGVGGATEGSSKKKARRESDRPILNEQPSNVERRSVGGNIAEASPEELLRRKTRTERRTKKQFGKAEKEGNTKSTESAEGKKVKMGTAASGSQLTSNLEVNRETTDQENEEQRRLEKKRRKAAKKKARKEAAQIEEIQAERLAEEAIAVVDDALLETAGSDLQQEVAHSESSSWSLSVPAAGRFIHHDPLFVRDPNTGEEYLITSNGREVQLLSIDTSLVVRSCPVPDGCSVTLLSLGSAEDQVSIVYDDSTIVRWNWTSEALAEISFQAKGDVQSMDLASKQDRNDLVYVSQVDDTFAIFLQQDLLYTTPRPIHWIRVLGKSDYVVASGPSALVVGMRKGSGQGRSDYVWVELPLATSVVCTDARLTYAEGTSKKDQKRHAVLSLAVGNVEGQIYLYADITSIFAQGAQASLPPPRILHWHREAVSSVRFTPDGNYLVSGGKETVLVLWQLETGKKQFLPHLTSEIERIVVSPEGDKYAVQMGDNSIMVLSTSELKPIANFAGLQLACPVPSTSRRSSHIDSIAAERPVAAVLNPLQPTQLLLTVPATQPKLHTEAAHARPFLQTFDLRAARHTARQALTRNNVTDFNLGPEKTPIASPDVAHLAISKDGQWLATVDEWMPPASDLAYLAVDEGLSVEEERRKRREVYLKFWRWNEVHGLWTLSTRVDGPHKRASRLEGAGRVIDVVSNPATNGFATIGEDGCVQLWRARARVRHGVVVKGDDDVEVVEWTSRRSMELPRISLDVREDSVVDEVNAVNGEGATTACVAFSGDGSVLAAAVSANDEEGGDSLVHFIDTYSGDIKSTRSGMAPSTALEAIAILERYFIVVSRGHVHVWDLVADSMIHRFNTPSGKPLLAVNDMDGTFAVAVGERVEVYRPKESHVIHTMHCESNIVKMLAGKGQRGYTMLFEDVTVRTLSFTGSTVRHALLPPSAEDAVGEEKMLAIEAAPEVDGLPEDMEMAEVLALPESDAESRYPVLDVSAEDDRPVVRPEQLASVLETMPPVRDMFHAVVGLFGRKPQVVSAAA